MWGSSLCEGPRLGTRQRRVKSASAFVQGLRRDKRASPRGSLLFRLAGEPMTARLIIFDIDGTLCDTFNVDDECFCEAAAELLNAPVALSSWEEAPHLTDAGIAEWLWHQYLKRSPTVEELQAFAEAYESALCRELQRAPHRFSVVRGVPSLLDRLIDERWDVAIATGGWSRLARLKLRAARVPDELLLASSDDSPDRSEVFLFAQERAAKRRGEPYAKTVLVGDGIWDVRVAAAHGWCFLGVGKEARAKRLLAEGATAVVEDFSDLSRVLNLLESCSRPEVGETFKDG
jgi:phosphoglycolate phosphatase-like HAD superfamily hydrolase